jgi:hypothetical protein
MSTDPPVDPPPEIDYAGVASKIRNALAKLLYQEKDLFTRDANERSLTHHLAKYLEEEFREVHDLHVDCEYNRQNGNPKKLPVPAGIPLTTTTDDRDAITVYPDIIIHLRGTDRNLLVIEAKKSNRQEGRDRDLNKLTGFLGDKRFRYRFAAFIEFDVDNSPPGASIWLWLGGTGPTEIPIESHKWREEIENRIRFFYLL